MRLSKAFNIPEFNPVEWTRSVDSRITPKGIQCVYFAVSKGCIVYVGATKCLKTRLTGNGYLRPNENVYYTTISDGKFKFEAALIKLLKPKFNEKTGTPAKGKAKKLKQVSIYVLPKYVKLVKAKCLAIAARYR